MYVYYKNNTKYRICKVKILFFGIILLKKIETISTDYFLAFSGTQVKRK